MGDGLFFLMPEIAESTFESGNFKRRGRTEFPARSGPFFYFVVLLFVPNDKRVLEWLKPEGNGWISYRMIDHQSCSYPLDCYRSGHLLAL